MGLKAQEKAARSGLGVGVGYRSRFAGDFTRGRPDVSWIEVVTENFLPAGGRDTLATQTLRRLRRDYPLALHGVGLSLGSADPLNEEYLRNLAWLEREMAPFLVTDHLCWAGVGDSNLHDLLPVPHTPEAFELVAGKIERVQDLLGRPMAIENITYYGRPAVPERGEAEFLNDLGRRTGCGFLLDINNIYVNSVNFRRDPLDFLRRIDLGRVVEIHLAGHEPGKSGLLIDTHGAPVADEVWTLYEWVQERIGVVPTMIERDDNIPEWGELEKELAKLRALQGKAKEAAREAPRMAGTLFL
jgi:uncharacterized protein (UPF0276 family)